MNKYLLLTTLLLTFNVNAKTECYISRTEDKVDEQLEINTDVPKHLRGATITITLKDGSSSVVPAEKFKVVPRLQQFIVTKTSKTNTQTCNIQDSKKHRVSVMGGKGAQEGLNVNNTSAPDVVSIESRVGAVMGAQYQYKTDLEVLDMPVSIGVQGQSNQTGSLMLGIDF